MSSKVYKGGLPVLKNIIHKCGLNEIRLERRQISLFQTRTFSHSRTLHSALKHFTDKNLLSNERYSCYKFALSLSPVFRMTCVAHRSVSTRNKNLPIIYLFTKDNCTLCDEAKAVLKPYMHRFTLEEVDITLPENADWYNLYKYDIPVFHMYEDFLFKHRVDLEVLEKALEQHENQKKTS